MSDYVYSEDPYQHVVKVIVTIGRPFVKVLFRGTAPVNMITVTGVSLSSVPIQGGGPDGRNAWGIVPFGGSVGIDVPLPTETPVLLQDAHVQLFLYDDATPGALEDAIAAAAGGIIVDVPGSSYAAANSFSNQAGYDGTLESIVVYSGLVFSLDEMGGMTSQVTFPDGIHGTIVIYDPPLHPLL